MSLYIEVIEIVKGYLKQFAISCNDPNSSINRLYKKRRGKKCFKFLMARKLFIKRLGRPTPSYSKIFILILMGKKLIGKRRQPME